MTAINDAPATEPAFGLSRVERDALADERDQLLRSIEDLEREHKAGDIDANDYQTLLDSYTARAANVLRQLNGEPEAGSAFAEQGSTARDADGDRDRDRENSRTTTMRAKKPRWRSAAIMAAVVACAVGTGVLVARSAGERVGSAGLTGSVRSAANQRQDQIDSLLNTARSSMATDPLGALKAYDGVRQLDPQNVEAITYGGWLVRNVGRSATDDTQRKELISMAIRRLDEAVTIDPTFPDALAFRAIVYLRDQNDPKAAAALFDRLDRLNPPEQIKQLVGSAAQEARTAAK